MLKRAIVVGLALLAVDGLIRSGSAQAGDRDAYFRAVSEFFKMPEAEVEILGEWRLPAEEVPVALFIARRAGVSAEAVVALRRSGEEWSVLMRRYRLDPGHLYVPLETSVPAGRLAAAYDRYRSVDPRDWPGIDLSSREIVDLVNLRIVAQTLRLDPAEVLAASTGSWVQVFDRLLGRLGQRAEVGR